MPTVREPSAWAPLRFSVVAAAAVVLYGVAGYVLIFDWSVMDAIYMTVITMTTVGYLEVRPMDDAGRIFTITLLVPGTSVLLLTLSIAATVLIENPVRERLRKRRMDRRIAGLRGHHIVCGFGRVGRTVAESLRSEGADLVVIDKSESRAAELGEAGYFHLIGDATDREDLATAGIHRAASLITAVDDDAENIFITMTARAVNPDLWIVARASEETTRDRLETAGANRVYSPFVTAGREMATAAVSPGVLDFIELETEGQPVIRLEEIEVEAGSSLVGRRLGDVAGAATPLALRRTDGSLLAPPDPGVDLREGDVLVMLGQREALRPLEAKDRAGG